MLHGCFFFLFPLPNLSKPAELSRTIDTLEKSDQTKALAYASETNAFGSKMYVWGKYTSTTQSQDEVNTIALNACTNSLERYKAMTEGGQPKYNFGTNKCELYQFSNKTTPISSPQPQQTQPVPVDSAPKTQIIITSPVDSNKVTTSPTEKAPDLTIESKLRTLQNLRSQQLITEQEYQQKRKEALQGL